MLNLLAVAEGIKPCMDDWIPVRAYDVFTQLCRQLALHVEAGVQFDVMTHEEVDSVTGRQTLTTTRARARELGDERGSVHVFVGRDPEVVRRTFHAGWYPLVVEGSATSKPWIDHIWFGRGLGYPECCLHAFARNNNWAVNNMPYQAYRITAAPNALCNSIMRFTGLTWAPHLPCAYDCQATIDQSRAVRELVAERAPGLVEIVDALTTGTFLLLSEWEAFALQSPTTCGNTVDYQGVSLVPSNKPNRPLFDALGHGERLEIRDDLIVVSRREKVSWIERCRTDGFAPRIPVVLTFPELR
ncbi:hypothetical protein [Nocardia salmonicida]|uniref:hypothetical protein n=1 Tax=Nocardia salmonicida TaxID=53431 RepID=UPI0033E7D171